MAEAPRKSPGFELTGHFSPVAFPLSSDTKETITALHLLTNFLN